MRTLTLTLTLTATATFADPLPSEIEKDVDIEEHLGELSRVGVEQAVVAVADAFRKTHAVVQRAHRNAGAKQIGDLHRNVHA